MGSDIIKVNTLKLGEDSEDINQYIKDLDTQMSSLKNSISELNKMWEGESYKAFKAAVDSDLSALQTLIENLQKVYQYEQRAKTDYDNCEQQVARIIDEIIIKEV